MPTDKKSAEFELLARLRRSPVLRAIGCDAMRGLSGSICLSMSGRHIGTWWYDSGEFRFGAVANRPHCLEARTAAQAVEKSIELATRQITGASHGF